MAQKRTDGKRAGISFAFIVLLGLAIGFLIKRVHVGLMIGLVLGIVASGMMRRR